MAYEPVDFSQGYYTTHDCASVLKSLIGDLSEPLLQERLFNAHLHSLGGFESLTVLLWNCIRLLIWNSRVVENYVLVTNDLSFSRQMACNIPCRIMSCTVWFFQTH